MILALLASAADIIAVSLMNHLQVPAETLEPMWLYTSLMCFLYISLWQAFGFVWRKASNVQRVSSGFCSRYFKNDALAWIVPFVTVIAAVFLAGHLRLALGMEVERLMFVVIPGLAVGSASEFRADIEPLLPRDSRTM